MARGVRDSNPRYNTKQRQKHRRQQQQNHNEDAATATNSARARRQSVELDTPDRSPSACSDTKTTPIVTPTPDVEGTPRNGNTGQESSSRRESSVQPVKVRRESFHLPSHLSECSDAPPRPVLPPLPLSQVANTPSIIAYAPSPVSTAMSPIIPIPQSNVNTWAPPPIPIHHPQVIQNQMTNAMPQAPMPVAPLLVDKNKFAPPVQPPGSASPIQHYPQLPSDITDKCHSVQAVLSLSNLMEKKGKVADACEVLRQGCDKFQNCGKLHVELAKAILGGMGRLGHYDEGMYHCDMALKCDPRDAVAMALKAELYRDKIIASVGFPHASVELDKAVNLMENARRLDPTLNKRYSELLLIIGQHEATAGCTGQAHHRWRLSHEADPTNIRPLYALAAQCFVTGQREDAKIWYQKILDINPRCPEAWNDLGVLHRLNGHIDEAINCFRLAVQNSSPVVELFRQELANCLVFKAIIVRNNGNSKASRKLCKEALYFFGRLAHAYYNLALTYVDDKKMNKALLSYEQAIFCDPRHGDAWNNMGVIYRDMGHFDMSAKCYEKAIQNNSSRASCNLGALYGMLGYVEQAVFYTRQSIQRAPNYAPAYNNVGVFLRDGGNRDEAFDAFNRCLQLQPTNAHAGNNRLLTLNYMELPHETVESMHAEWGEDICRLSTPPFRSWLVEKTPAKRPLRVGYVSPDLITHSVSYFIHSALQCHDPSRVEVYVYSHVMREDVKTEMFKHLVPNWNSIVGIDDPTAAAMIRNDQIDILVELAGHCSNNRLNLMALKPAPVIISMIGYPNITGMPTIDYRIVDRFTDPPDHPPSSRTAEELYRLPGCFLCYTPYFDPPVPLPKYVPSSEHGIVTFGCYNNLAKAVPRVWNLFRRILLAVPNSRLSLKYKPFICRSVRRSIASYFGDVADRVDMMGHLVTTGSHLESYNNVDVALDTFPYGGTTTTCEALYMGVPVVSLATHENCHAQNVGRTLLEHVGIAEECVAWTEDEYLQKAVALAGDANRLNDLRKNLRGKLLASPLCDQISHTKNLEDAYEVMFNRWATDEREPSFAECQKVCAPVLDHDLSIPFVRSPGTHATAPPLPSDPALKANEELTINSDVPLTILGESSNGPSAAA